MYYHFLSVIEVNQISISRKDIVWDDIRRNMKYPFLDLSVIFIPNEKNVKTMTYSISIYSRLWCQTRHLEDLHDLWKNFFNHCVNRIIVVLMTLNPVVFLTTISSPQ